MQFVRSRQGLIKNLIIGACLVGFALLICMQSPLNPVTHHQASGTDSSVFRYIAQEMRDGKIPYRDTFDHKGPLLYGINYLGLLMSPEHGVWLIELLFMFVSLILAYRIARRYVSVSIALAIIAVVFSLFTVFFEGGNLTEEYALPFQLLALTLFLQFFDQSQRKVMSSKTTRLPAWLRWFNLSFFINGVCAAAVLLLRPNMIAIWLICCIMVIIHQIYHKKYLALVQLTTSFIVGVLVVLLPTLLILAMQGIFGDFIECYLLFNLHYSSGASFADKAQTAIAFFSYSVVGIAFVIMLFCTYSQIKHQDKRRWLNLGYIALLVVALGLVSLSGYTFNHYGMTLIPVLIYPYCQLYLLCSNFNPKARPVVQTIISLYLVTTLALPALNVLAQNLITQVSNRHQAPYTNEVIAYIQQNTTPTDTISVFGNQDALYVYSGRRSASRYSYQYPIAQVNTEIQEQYLEDLSAQLPKLVILQDTSESEFSTRLQQFFITNHYSKVPNLPIYIRG